MNALKPSAYAHARILESARTRSLITLTGSIRKTLGKRRRLKEACYLTLSRIPGRVEPIVSLFRILAIGRLCRRKSAQNVTAVPYNAGSGASLQRSGFREIPTNFSTSVAC